MNLYDERLIKKIDEGFRNDDFFNRIIEHSRQNKNAGDINFPERLDWFIDVAHEWYIQGVIVGMNIAGEIEINGKNSAL